MAVGLGGARRALAGLPSHLRTPFLPQSNPTTCMIVGNPFWRYPIALAKPTLEVAPLIDAIKSLDVRPFRIVSHETEDGKARGGVRVPFFFAAHCSRPRRQVFNASFFEDSQCMNGFLKWYSKEALQPGGAYQAALAHALAPGELLPTPDSLLFGKGVQLLSDTRYPCVSIFGTEDFHCLSYAHLPP